MADRITIRREEHKDWEEVEYLTRKAFWSEENIKEIGVGATEHYMVHKMRGNDGIGELTLVAEMGGQVVGHIIYSNSSYVLQTDNSKKKVLNFGPLSVLPKYQNMGIGSMLMEKSIQIAKDAGYGAILFFGHPTYYPRFGFVEAKNFNITTTGGKNFPAFMAMELQDGYLDNVSGRYIEGKIYDERLTKAYAKEYDKNFENLS